MTETETAEATLSSPEAGGKRIRQQVQVVDAGPCRKHLKVTVEEAEIRDRFESKFAEVSGDAQVKGFRPGKAPRKLIENRYKREILEQMKNELLLQSLEQLSEDKSISPISPPDLDPSRVEIPDKGDFIYEFEVEVRPEFQLPEYQKLNLKKPVHTYSPEEIAREERRVLSTYGLPIEKNGAVALGDRVTASGPVRLGDREIGKLKNTSFVVDRKLAFKDGIANSFGDQISGKKVGDKAIIDIDLMRNQNLQDLQGLTVQAELTIEAVEEIRIPELNEDFLEQFGVTKPDEFRELIEVILKRRLEHQQRQVARQQFMGFIEKEMTWDLPQDLLIKQARTAMARRVMEMRADGISEDEILKRQRILSQDILKSTERALKEHFVLQRIAEAESLEVSVDDIDDEVRRIAAREGESARRVRARMEKDDLIDALAAELLERKAIDFIMDGAEFEEVPLELVDRSSPEVATSDAQAVSEAGDEPAAEPIPGGTPEV
ncbi:MAG: trigger factor [Planctomycetota bacterium]|nr:trigger factor [Planctomycetota bacterium]